MTDAAAAASLPDENLTGDFFLQSFHMGDDAAELTAAHLSKHGNRFAEALTIQAAEALIDKERLDADATTFLARNIRKTKGQGQ